MGNNAFHITDRVAISELMDYFATKIYDAVKQDIENGKTLEYIFDTLKELYGGDATISIRDFRAGALCAVAAVIFYQDFKVGQDLKRSIA